MPHCFHCKAETPRDHYLRIVENKFAISWEDWDGWRFSGRFLIAPGKAGRILPRRRANGSTGWPKSGSHGSAAQALRA